MTDSKTEIDFSTEIAQSLNRFNQALKDDNKMQRINALKKVLSQMSSSYKTTDPTVLKFTTEAVKSIFKTSLNVLNDPIEKCRELTCELLLLVLECEQSWDAEMTGSLVMIVFQRLGGSVVKESSEEIRLQLFRLIERLLELKSDKNKSVMEIHLQEFVSILINGFEDQFPDAKKCACQCSRLLANKLASHNFHMQSESLVKPILQNMTHQHSRVRKDMADALCDVIMHGNNKSVDTALPHLAQRLFDQAGAVRTSVVKLCGTWLLELPDRYSFWHKLLPLLLTGFSDESMELKELTESLWWDVGMKYQKENEADMKDKLDFLNEALANYPTEFQDRRPNAGCRELIRLNSSKILPGILNDMSDWVEATRIKSVQLLYTMIWQCEAHITMSLETVLQTLFKASHENCKEIQTEIHKCAKLLGHFTDPSLSFRFAYKAVQKLEVPNPGSLVILNGLILGHGERTPFPIIIEYLKLLNEISLTVDVKLQPKLLTCLENLLPMSKFTLEFSPELAAEFEYLMFKNVFSLTSLITEPSAKASADQLTASLKSANIMAEASMRRLVRELSSNCQAWNDNSFEPIVFAKLVKDYGLSEETVATVIGMLKVCLEPSKDVQLRTRFLLLIPEIFHCAKADEVNRDSNNPSLEVKSSSFLETSIEVIINDMITPNVQWKAGRSAGAVRMSAIASLGLLIQSNAIKQVQVKLTTIENLLTLLVSVLDDDNKSTRLYVCKIYHVILKHFGALLSKDHLHKLYPEFIKRLDDSSDEIRNEVLNVFSVYMKSLDSDYDSVLYGGHLQFIFENILLYLDDANLEIQVKVFELLKQSAHLKTELMLEEIEKVKAKHRSSKYCDELIAHCKSLRP